MGLHWDSTQLKITAEILDDGNVPNPDNVKTWVHVWTSGKGSLSDLVASFGAWLDQRNPDIRIVVNTKHDDVCYIYKKAEHYLLLELVDNGNVSARVVNEWKLHECYTYTNA